MFRRCFYLFSVFSFKRHILPFIIAFVVTALILSGISVLFSFFPPSEMIFSFFSRYTYLLSGFIAAFLVARRSSKRGFLAGIIAADIYTAVLFLLGTLVFKATADISSLARIFALSSLFGAIGGTIGINCK